MSLSVIARVPEETEETEGSDDDSEYAGWTCEACGSEDFRLPVWRGLTMIVCIDCSQPQEGAIWTMTDGD